MSETDGTRLIQVKVGEESSVAANNLIKESLVAELDPPLINPNRVASLSTQIITLRWEMQVVWLTRRARSKLQ